MTVGATNATVKNKMPIDSWIWREQLHKARELVPWKEAEKLLPKAIRPQHHIEQSLMKTNKNVNVCGYCKYAYRSDKEGKVMCGNPLSGKAGEEIRKPFEENCRKWSLRRKEQPPIYRKKENNQALARYVKKLNRGI